MRRRFVDRDDVLAKVDWEGGLLEAVFGYGLSWKDLPENDSELIQAWRAMQEGWDAHVEPHFQRVRELLGEE